MTEALVNRVLAPSFLDGPGSRLVFFLQGCDLACGYCHNPETWSACGHCGRCLPACPGGALALAGGAVVHDPDRCLGCDRCLAACPAHASPRCRTLDVDAVLALARTWAPYVDGVTFSGGECTLQGPFLRECLPRLRAELGLETLLDTNGNLPAPVLETLLAVAGGFLVDLKSLDPEVHRRLTGAGNGTILANLRRTAQAGRLAEVRHVLIPGHTDDPAQVLALARLVQELGPAVPLRLIPFRPQGVRGAFAQVPALDPARFRALCAPARALLGGRLKTREAAPCTC